jgi:hypothetical protein
MTQRGQYGKWIENELQMAVAAYRNGDCGLNECSRVYGVPKATIRWHTMKKIWYVSGVKALGRQATFFGDMEEIVHMMLVLFPYLIPFCNISCLCT